MSITNIVERIIYAPLYLYFKISKSTHNISEEIENWSNVLLVPEFGNKFYTGIWLLANLKEFRSLLYFRYNTWKFNPFKLLYPGIDSLYFTYGQKIWERIDNSTWL